MMRERPWLEPREWGGARRSRPTTRCPRWARARATALPIAPSPTTTTSARPAMPGLYTALTARLPTLNDSARGDPMQVLIVNQAEVRRLLPMAECLGVLQAAVLLVRPLRRVRVWSRDPAHVAHFVEAARRRHRLDIQPAASAREAVEDADVVCTVTSSREPVLEGAWLRPGTHVNAVGASVRAARELDSAAVAAARVFVDRRESAANEAGDLLIPRAEGAIGDDHVQGELGEVLIGKVGGRRTETEITVFKSLGLAVEDVASAHHIHARARAAGVGTWVELGGGRDASG